MIILFNFKVKCFICNKGFADSRDLKKHMNVHNKQNDRYCVNGVMCPVKNNQRLPPLNDLLSQLEPMLKLDEVANVSHPIDDEMLNIEQIKNEVLDPRDAVECVMDFS